MGRLYPMQDEPQAQANRVDNYQVPDAMAFLSRGFVRSFLRAGRSRYANDNDAFVYHADRFQILPRNQIEQFSRDAGAALASY